MTSKTHNQTATDVVAQDTQAVYRVFSNIQQYRGMGDAYNLTMLVHMAENATLSNTDRDEADRYSIRDFAINRGTKSQKDMTAFLNELQVQCGFKVKSESGTFQNATTTDANGQKVPAFEKETLEAFKQSVRRVLPIVVYVLDHGGSDACWIEEGKTPQLRMIGKLCLIEALRDDEEFANSPRTVGAKGTVSLTQIATDANKYIANKYGGKTQRDDSRTGGKRGETGKARTQEKSDTSDKSSKSGTGQTTQGTASQAENWKQDSHAFQDRVKWLKDLLAVQPDNAPFGKETLKMLAELDHEIRRFVDPNQYERQPQKAQTNDKSRKNNANTRAAK